MKKFKFILLIGFLGFLTTTTAQLNVNDLESIYVEEGEKVMSQGRNNAMTITIPGASDKAISKIWTKKLKKFKGGKTKKVKKSKELLSDNIEIASIGGSNTVDVYSLITGNTLTVWYDLGGAYLNSYDHADKYAGAEALMKDLAKQVFVGMVEDELKDQEDVLKKKEKDFDKLVKDKENLEKDIENYKEKIKQAEADIETNIVNQEKTQESIVSQKDVVEEVKSRLTEIKQH